MLRTLSVLAGFALFVGLSSVSAQEKPKYPAQLIEGKLSIFTVYLQDSEKGFYRGARFDRTSIIADWKFAGHTIFHAWKDKHDPTNNDDITGPCEEFRGELGYAEAKVGETFVKIGVGELRKPEEKEYRFWHNYAVVGEGRESYGAGKGDAVQIRAASLPNGYGYRLERKVETADGDGVAGIRFTTKLTNTGTKPINTRVYNHNFFNVDRDPIGPNYSIEFDATVKVFEPKERFAELTKIDGRMLSFTAKLDKGSIFSDVKGFSKDGYRFTLRHKPTKLKLVVSSDRPASQFQVWGISTTLCPEPYFDIDDLQPEKSTTWSTLYRLSQEG